MKITIIYIILTVSISTFSFSQNKIANPDIVTTENTISDLKEGTLVLVLRSEKRKIEILEELLKDDTRSIDFINRTQLSLQEIKSERDKRNVAMINAFRENYNFSHIEFLYDYGLNNLISTDSLLFIKNNLKLQKQSKPDKLYIAKLIRSARENSSNIYTWKIHNAQLEMIADPFPNSFAIAPIKSAFRSLFSNSTDELNENASEIAIKINKEFTEYYQKKNPN